MPEKLFDRVFGGEQKPPTVSETMSGSQRAQIEVWLLNGDAQPPKTEDFPKYGFTDANDFNAKLVTFRGAWATGKLGGGAEREVNEKMLGLLKDQYQERMESAKATQEIITQNPKVFEAFMQERYGDMLKTIPIEKLQIILFKHIDKLAFQNGADMGAFAENLKKLKSQRSMVRHVYDMFTTTGQGGVAESQKTLDDLKTTFEKYRAGETEASQDLLKDLDTTIFGGAITSKEEEPMSDPKADEDAKLYREAVNPEGETWKKIEAKWEEEKKKQVYTTFAKSTEKQEYRDNFFEEQMDLLQPMGTGEDKNTRKKSSNSFIGRMLRKIFGSYGKNKLTL